MPVSVRESTRSLTPFPSDGVWTTWAGSSRTGALWHMPDTASATRTARVLAEKFGPQPFTSRQAHDVVSPRALRTAVARGTVQRLRRGAYAVAHESDLTRYRLRITAALVARPAAVASSEAALALTGFSQPHFGEDWDSHPVYLTATRGERVRNSRLHVSTRALPDDHCVVTSFGPATTPRRTAVDLSRRLAFPLALVVADEACAAELIQQALPDADPRARPSGSRALLADRGHDARDLLLRTSHEAPLRTGVARVRRVAEWVDPAAESPGESLSRAHLVAAGLPRPVVGLSVTGDDGRTYYADLAWPEFAVIGEVDGYGKYRADTWQTFRREKQREDALRAAGWLVVRWTVTEVLRDPGSVVARVRRALLTARRQASRRIPS